MTDKEAIEYGKKWGEAIESRGDTPFSEARQFLSLAIKALEVIEKIKKACLDSNSNLMFSHKTYDILCNAYGTEEDRESWIKEYEES